MPIPDLAQGTPQTLREAMPQSGRPSYAYARAWNLKDIGGNLFHQTFNAWKNFEVFANLPHGMTSAPRRLARHSGLSVLKFL